MVSFETKFFKESRVKQLIIGCLKKAVGDRTECFNLRVKGETQIATSRRVLKRTGHCSVSSYDAE